MLSLYLPGENEDNFSQDSRCPSRVLNWASPENNPEALQLRATSVGMTFAYFRSRVKQTSWVTGYWTQLPQCNCCCARDRPEWGSVLPNQQETIDKSCHIWVHMNVTSTWLLNLMRCPHTDIPLAALARGFCKTHTTGFHLTAINGMNRSEWVYLLIYLWLIVEWYCYFKTT